MICDFVVDLNKFNIIKFLGEGAFGRVYLIEEKTTKELFSAKITKYQIKSTLEQKSFFTELVAYSKVKYPSILALIGFNMNNFKEESFPTLITEYMPNGSLDCFLKKNPYLTPAKKYIILYGIAKGMNHLHSQKIIHRDLKPGNVLLDENLYPHICDFGESKILDLASSTSMLAESYSGTPLYMAPEIFKEDPYTEKVDVFSFSIMAYEIITGQFPYPGFKTIYKLQNAVKNGKRPDLTIIENEYVKMLLIKCWSNDPKERPAFSQIVENIKSDEFINGIGISDRNEKLEIEKYSCLFNKGLPPLNNRSNKITIEVSKKANEEKPSTKKSELISLKKNAESSPPKSKPEVNEPKIKPTQCSPRPKARIKETNENLSNIKREESSPDNKSSDAYKTDSASNKYVDQEQIKRAQQTKIQADEGNVDSMNKYGLMLIRGDGVTVNLYEATRYFKMAADKEDSNGLFYYGKMLDRGSGVKVNKEEAARYYKMAADKGNANAMVRYGIMLGTGEGIPVNKAEATRYFKMLADKGDANGMYNYGVMLGTGEGTLANKEEAARYYKMAADKGHVNAMYNYAFVLEKYKELQGNKEEISRYYKMAADKGDVAAMYCYGKSISVGEESNKYIKMAADRGYKNAMIMYSFNLFFGIGIQKNEEESDRYSKMIDELEENDNNK
ncbi:hypothetical protein M9Y10_032727 [Tritrichomonas musculus]|uniref:Protein kinase domain-containing protein n=1 Tax=Tritrichomonas musculus TaxID=1915356 RepID=A0ABR2GXM7_9EUKA